MSAGPRFRPLRFPVNRVVVREGAAGVRYVKAVQPLEDHAPRMTDRLLHWARETPARTFMARRVRNADGSTGPWRHISYAQALDAARRIAQALLERGLSPERPVAILSENSLEHALLALGCIYAGVPYCPVSPAYSTISQDYDKLRHVLNTLTPGLVFATDGAKYGKAIAATVGADVEVVLGTLGDGGGGGAGASTGSARTALGGAGASTSSARTDGVGSARTDGVGSARTDGVGSARTDGVDAARTDGVDAARTGGVGSAPMGVAGSRRATNFADLLRTEPTRAVDAAMHATGPDTITKFLFTSGSTKLPKAVINTHAMWCANQQQMRQSMPVLAEEPPVLVDWLPWNHTFGGNHNVGLTLYNGGTLYIDDGKPVPALIGETLRNLREIAPTVYFNVPTGFEAIANAMKVDDALRRNLLSRVRMFFYAGAALAQPVWDTLHEVQEREIGERIVMGTGLGMTESSPFAIFITNPDVKAGYLGVPAPGLELKLVPVQGKLEVRYKGPNVTPGYWRNEAATRECLDDEGFFCTGDAVLWINENDVHQGLKFDGRIAEDFKLATGTFVSVGPLRAKIIAAGAPYVQDAVITGINLNEVGALIFPTAAVRELAALPVDASLRQVLESPAVQSRFQQVVDELARTATGSANRIARMHLLHEPPSIDKGEVTDKGSINQRAVLHHRESLIEAFHGDTLPFTLKPSSATPACSA